MCGAHIHLSKNVSNLLIFTNLTLAVFISIDQPENLKLSRQCFSIVYNTFLKDVNLYINIVLQEYNNEFFVNKPECLLVQQRKFKPNFTNCNLQLDDHRNHQNTKIFSQIATRYK